MLAAYRTYDPYIGRWISRDPIGEQGGINLYAYVGNDPVNGADPSGLFASAHRSSCALTFMSAPLSASFPSQKDQRQRLNALLVAQVLDGRVLREGEWLLGKVVALDGNVFVFQLL
jgi:uncharacterized protein RhaS with RHS repeats